MGEVDWIGFINSGYDPEKDRVSWTQVEEFLDAFHGGDWILAEMHTKDLKRCYYNFRRNYGASMWNWVAKDNRTKSAGQR